MIMATTTSTKDSGLLDELVPAFERTGDCKVKTVAVGSGQALAMGEKGDADVLLVHSPDAEETFMDEGHGASRTAVMHNDFVIVGPASDPANIADAPDATTAFRRIAREKAPFASRADESGTNAKELKLWEEAGIKPSGSWYLETGQGMGETLTVASQKEAYTLSDRGTFLATKNLDSKLLKEMGGPAQQLPRDRRQGPGHQRRLREGLLELDHQRPHPEGDRGFGVKEYGEPLFFPDAGVVRARRCPTRCTRSSRARWRCRCPRRCRTGDRHPAGHSARAVAHPRPGLLATVNTGMAVPTVVVGLLVALVLWRSGPLGNLDLIYTVRGMIIAQVLIATPLITGITMAAVRLLPPEFRASCDHSAPTGGRSCRGSGWRRGCRCWPPRWRGSGTRSPRSGPPRSWAATSTGTPR